MGKNIGKNSGKTGKTLEQLGKTREKPWEKLENS